MLFRSGGTAPTVFNAANEVAVQAFLRDEIPFGDIMACVERTLGAHDARELSFRDSCRDFSHDSCREPTFDDLLAADAWAREAATRQIQLSTTHFR